MRGPAAGVTTIYTLDPAAGLTERLGSTTAGASTWYARGWGQELTRDASGTLTYLLADRLGSIRAEASSAGTLTTSLNFDPYGQPQGTAPTDFGFTGEPQAEAGAGLVHLRARWYAPGSGGFVSRDAYQGEAGSPRSQQPYGYALQAPTTWTDPSGFCSGAAGDDDYTCLWNAPPYPLAAAALKDIDLDLPVVFVAFNPGKAIRLGDAEWCTQPIQPDEDGEFDLGLTEADIMRNTQFISTVEYGSLQPPKQDCDYSATDFLDSFDPRQAASPTNILNRLMVFSHAEECERARFIAKPVARVDPFSGRLSLVFFGYFAKQRGGDGDRRDTIWKPGSGRPLGELLRARRYLDILKKMKDSAVGFAIRRDYRKTFFEHFPELKDKVSQVHHAIEQQILDKYPGLFLREEIDSLENLRGIPKGMEGVHYTRIRQRWDEFYETHPGTATRAQVLEEARQQDDLFGDMYLPRIRD